MRGKWPLWRRRTLRSENAKAWKKPYKLGDSGGLFLLVQPTGGKLWRLKYRIDGKEKKLGLGTYPDVSLADARKRRDAAKTELSAGKDPGVEKVRRKAPRQISAGNAFATVTAGFINKRTKEGWSLSTQEKADYLLQHLTPTWARCRWLKWFPLTCCLSSDGPNRRGSSKRHGGCFNFPVRFSAMPSPPTLISLVKVTRLGVIPLPAAGPTHRRYIPGRYADRVGRSFR
ncbi:symbiosis island integrase [Sphingobium sp. MI1205]|nr:symbiosis island integrase [Sphingobium sp. MI1205]